MANVIGDTGRRKKTKLLFVKNVASLFRSAFSVLSSPPFAVTRITFDDPFAPNPDVTTFSTLYNTM
jgi:hypothetical protein